MPVHADGTATPISLEQLLVVPEVRIMLIGQRHDDMIRLIVERTNLVAFSDLREYKKPPPDVPRERHSVTPVLGPAPFNPRNAGMDIRRFLPRRMI